MSKLVDKEPTASFGILEGSALDHRLWDGHIEFHQHAAALAYAKLRRKDQAIDLDHQGISL